MNCSPSGFARRGPLYSARLPQSTGPFSTPPWPSLLQQVSLHSCLSRLHPGRDQDVRGLDAAGRRGDVQEEEGQQEAEGGLGEPETRFPAHNLS